MNVFRLSKTENKIYSILSDGRVHKFDELCACLTNGDTAKEINKRDAVNSHLARMRKRLRPRGLDILCVVRNRQFQYQMIKPLYSSE